MLLLLCFPFCYSALSSSSTIFRFVLAYCPTRGQRPCSLEVMGQCVNEGASTIRSFDPQPCFQGSLLLFLRSLRKREGQLTITRNPCHLYSQIRLSKLLSEAPNGNFRENICSEDDLRSRIFGAFVVKFLACLPLLRFSNIYKMV